MFVRARIHFLFIDPLETKSIYISVDFFLNTQRRTRNTYSHENEINIVNNLARSEKYLGSSSRRPFGESGKILFKAISLDAKKNIYLLH